MIRLFSDSRCLSHEVPGGFPEAPERLASSRSYLESRGWEVVEPEAESTLEPPEDVFWVHEYAYVERFRKAIKRGDGLLDSADNPLSPGTWDAALAALVAALAAADWVVAGVDRQALALVRPPGHHAERSVARGFCFFNNVAVAAEHLLRRGGLERVAIFDFDVHHGNGTQHIFEDRSDVLFVSTHQYPFYPGTGAAGETGRGAGKGATLNLPLVAGTEDLAYLEVLEGQVVPTIEAFAPQALLVSAGFDAWRQDPVGGLGLSDRLFHLLGERIAALAADRCEGRVLAVLEGGYDLGSLPHLIDSYLAGLAGRPFPGRAH